MNIAIFGNPRGGTTWLAELLAKIPDSAICYEPLQRGFIETNGQMPPRERCKLKEVLDLDFYYYQPIPVDSNWIEAESFFDKFWNRQIIQRELFWFQDLEEVGAKKNWIVKFCFGHLLLPWLLNKYSFRPIVLTRHPCAVIASQLRHQSWRFIKKKPAFKLPNFKFNDHFSQYASILKTIKTPEENLAAMWAMTTGFLLKHPLNNQQWLTVSYENLYQNGTAEIARIFNYLAIDIPQDILKHLKTPSETTLSTSKTAIQNGTQTERWKSDLTQQQIENIQRILNAFDLK